MPGYIVHIAIAQEYLRKHNLKYSKEFIVGSVAPDFTDTKSTTHYGKSPAYTNLKNFLLKNDIDVEYTKGFFLHLVTDYLFYNKYITKIEKTQIYNDYDFTNENIIEKYKIALPKEVEDKVFFKEGKPKILTLDLAYKVIDEVSNLDLETVKKEVLEDNKKWNTYSNII